MILEFIKTIQDMIMKFFDDFNYILKELDYHKKKKMSAVPLDAAPERCTKRCSPRFRLGGRFWCQVSDTCRQAVRERNVGA